VPWHHCLGERALEGYTPYTAEPELEEPMLVERSNYPSGWAESGEHHMPDQTAAAAEETVHLPDENLGG
jgi:hypothetical protein